MNAHAINATIDESRLEECKEENKHFIVYASIGLNENKAWNCKTIVNAQLDGGKFGTTEVHVTAAQRKKRSGASVFRLVTTLSRTAVQTAALLSRCVLNVFSANMMQKPQA